MKTSASPKILAVIPARFDSVRFPGKMIAELDGRPLVHHAYMRAKAATLLDDVVIAADDERIVAALAPFDANVILTSRDHATGTDRVAEAARKSDADIIVNVQGDEALIDPKVIDDTIRPLLDQPDVAMATACRRIEDIARAQDPNVVKVVVNQQGHALYFSRAPIPHVRDDADAPRLLPWFQHIGLYVFRRDFLLQFAAMPQTPLEQLEKLEQLRVLEHGHTIAVVETDYECIGVDTPDDLEHVKRLLAAQH